MSGPAFYTVLNDSDAKELVLASDFSATGRTVPGFADLVAKLRPAYRVWETAPPAPGEEAAMAAEDYLERWVSDVRDSGLVVRAVLGYCVGSVFAAPLAERIAQWQEPPVVLVIDPERPHLALLHRHYHELLGGLSSVLSPDEIATARRAGADALARNEELAPLAAELSDLLREFGGIGFARAGLDEIRSEELVGTFRSFLHYLVVAGDIDPVPVWSTATAISSVSPLNGLNVLSARERETIVARDIRFGLEHAELLRDDEVVRVVAEALR